ncbi:surface protein C [Clostridium sp. CAG:793]|nr:surface protein C [Clostridium sp. CAG:793]
MKKYLSLILTIFMLVLLSTSVFAAETAKADATMTLVENNVCNITFGKYGEFEKKLIKCETNDKTIDIGLTVKNNQEALLNKAGEVVLLIDSSNSMSTRQVTIGDKTTTRKQLVLDSASQLVDKLLSSNSDIKIGVVEFATSTDVSKEGTEDDAKAITPALTNQKSDIISALNTISSDVMGSRTNIDIGLKTANKLLETSTDSDANKYIVVLTDAVPNTAEGVKVDLYTEASADPTKATLTSLKESGINVISMLIDIQDEEIKITGRPEDATFKTYKDVAQYVFGTPLSPTSGSVYYVNDSDVLDTVTNKIYSELVPVNEYVLTDIVIKDYFPQNIIDNFDFSYLTQPEIGTVSAEVDKTDNSITWTISNLAPGETANFSYRLSLKDTFSSEILDVNLPTNKNVTIDYKENQVPGDQKQNNKCPVVKLEVEKQPVDNTIIPDKEMPKTGSNTAIISGSLITLSIIIGAISFVAYKRS